MAVEGRIVPPAEWADHWKGIDSAHGFVVEVTVDGAKAAEWGALTEAHVEGLKVEEAFRGHAGVARALLTTMVEELKKHGIKEVVTNAGTPEVEQLIREAGGRQIPGTAWVIPIG